MKVVVTNPPWKTKREGFYGLRSNSRWPHIRPDKHLQFPIYLAYTSSLLKKDGHNVLAFDAVAEELDSHGFYHKIDQFKPDVVFMECATPSFDQDVYNAGLIKNLGCKVFLFGSHISAFTNEIVENHRNIDGFIRGEFEYIIKNVVDNLSFLNNVRGIAFWDHLTNKPVITEPAQNIKDLDSLPFPDRDSFKASDYYIHLDPKPNALLVTSRGCPYQCTYCIWPQAMNGHLYRARSAKNMVDEVEYLVKEKGIIFYRFDDDIFSLKKNLVIEFCNLIIERGIHKLAKWACFGHVNVPHEEMYKMMALSGCTRIDFGVESGSQKVLDGMKKNIDIEKAKKTFDLCRKYGIRTYADYMVGFPHESVDDIHQTIDSSIYIDPDYIQISYVIPIPGTSMYSDGIKNGWIDKDIPFEDYDSTGQIINTGDITEDDLKRMYNLFWKKFYMRPKLVFRELMRMVKSKNEFLRVIKGFKSFYTRVYSANRL